jgi:hypothetical protein
MKMTFLNVWWGNAGICGVFLIVSDRAQKSGKNLKGFSPESKNQKAAPHLIEIGVIIAR